MKMIELSDHFNCRRLLLYSLPAIGEILALTSFQLVDGLFIANYLGVNAFVVIDLILPPLVVIFSVGYMFGTGASAVIAQSMGEGDRENGRELFSLTTAALALFGIIAALIGTWQFPLLTDLVGVKGQAAEHAITYGRILLACLPAFLINAAFQSLWITAEKAWYGLFIAILNGFLNVVFDWLFMGPLGWGVMGAAMATVLSSIIAAVITVVYFLRQRTSPLWFVRPRFERLRELIDVCLNGSSEMIGTIALSTTTILANRQLLYYIGEKGVAAMGVFGGVMDIFLAIFMGVSSTVITLAGFKYGEKDDNELDGLVKTSSLLMFICGIVMCVLCTLFSGLIAWVYFRNDPQVYDLTARVLRISALSCLVHGFNIVTSSFFTGLGDSLGSAVIAAFCALVNPVAMIYILPAVFGSEGILWATPAASLLTAILAILFLKFRYPLLRKEMHDHRDGSGQEINEGS